MAESPSEVDADQLWELAINVIEPSYSVDMLMWWHRARKIWTKSS